MEMKKLKVATSRMAGYTGVLGPVRFTDGVSDEFLPRHIRDRMAASMEFIEVDADGNETPAGAQYRLLIDTQERAPQMDSLARQTSAEKAKEISDNVVASSKKLPPLETRVSLEALAEKSGIKGLREIGSKWAVKHRSIPTLIEMILDAQEKSVAARDKKLAAKSEAELERLKRTAPAAELPTKTPEAEIVTPELDPVPEEKVDEVVSATTSKAAAALSAKLKAAATGDFSAALDAEDEDVLLGSSVLASTYNISGAVVQLGDIVSSAHNRFGGTVAEWNELAADDREALLRLDLDLRLAAE